MKQYAVIHAVAGLYEGYSDTTCEFFPTKDAAQKHIDQILLDYGKDETMGEIYDESLSVDEWRTPADRNARDHGLSGNSGTPSG